MSLISSTMPINLAAITCLDFEKNSYPIELAVTLAHGRNYQAWIKPSDAVLSSLPANMINTINRSGKYPDQVCNELNLLCAGTNIFCDHWGLTTQWLDNLFVAASVERDFSCSPIESLLGDEGYESWNSRKQFVLDILQADDYSANSQLEVIQAVVNLFYREHSSNIENSGAVITNAKSFSAPHFA